jgi:flagellar basal-body rod modification protein FlgD
MSLPDSENRRSTSGLSFNTRRNAMQVATGIWAQHAASHAVAGASPSPMAGPANNNNGPGDSDSSTATISANDFLTLLVTEMQNQDPTDETDPNEYIDQLVQVNSLEQLIDINQNLSTVLGIPDGSSPQGSSSAEGTGSVSPQAAGLAPSTSEGMPAVVHPAAHKTSALGQVQSAAAASAATSAVAAHGKAGTKSTDGNLSVPKASPASRRVAHALAGRAAQ